MYCLFGTAGNDLACAIPGKKTTTGTLPSNVVLEKVRFGGVDLGAVGTVAPDGGTCFGPGESSPATVS